MDRQLTLQTAECITGEINEMIEGLPVEAKLKQALAGKMSRLLQLTAELAIGQTGKEKIIVWVELEECQLAMSLFLPPHSFSLDNINIGGLIIKPKEDFNHIAYNSDTNSTYISLKPIYSKEEYIAAGWTIQE